MATHPELSTNQKAHLPYFDGLRGLMALWVLAGHTLGAVGAGLPFLSKPRLAVDVFMIVSGFLMAYYFRVREKKEAWESPQTWAAFYLRRFFRIAPAYYLVLTLALLVREPFQRCAYETLTNFPRPPGAWAVHLTPDIAPLSWLDALAHYTFTFGFVPQFGSTTLLPDWSIGLEMQFYLALPFIMLLYRRTGPLASSLALLGMWVIANQLFSFGGGANVAPKPLGHFPMPTFLPLKLNCFLVGILLAESYFFAASQRRKSQFLCLLALGGAWITLDPTVAFIATFSALVLLYHGHSGPTWCRKAPALAHSLFSSRPCIFLADTSYGVYLIHQLLLWPIGAWLSVQPAFKALPGLEKFVLFFGMLAAIAYPLAYALHRLIEQPGVALGKQLSQRPPHSRSSAQTMAPRDLVFSEPQK